MIRVFLIVNLVAQCLGAATTITSCGGGTAYVGVTFTITCSISGSVTDGVVWTRPDTNSVVTCDAAGSCTGTSGYSGTQDAIVISSPSKSTDVGEFSCQDGFGTFTPCTLAVETPMSTTLVQNDLQSLTSQTISNNPSLTLTVVASCTTPVGTCTWTYQNVDTPSDTGTIDAQLTSTTSPTTSNGQTCSGSYVFTMCSLSITSVPSSLANRKVTISLTIAHPSLLTSITKTSSSVLTFSDSSSSGHWVASVTSTVIWFTVSAVLHLL